MHTLRLCVAIIVLKSVIWQISCKCGLHLHIYFRSFWAYWWLFWSRQWSYTFGLVCSGTEFDLVDCEIRDNTRQSSRVHSEDVGVKCQTSKGTR